MYAKENIKKLAKVNELSPEIHKAFVAYDQIALADPAQPLAHGEQQQQQRIADLEATIDGRNRRMQDEMAAIQSRKAQAKNNLAGATWEQSLSTEMQAVASKYQALNDADQARLGERFFRVLGSEQPGSGLGWSIVRRIAQLHGLLIDVARSPALGGLQVTLTWPGAAPSSTTTP